VVTSYLLSMDASNTEIADPNAVSAEEMLVTHEAQEQLQAALGQLPENNRRLIEDYYFRDATLEEIGGRLGLSKSWMCRMHARTLEMLRDLMEKANQAPVRNQAQPIATSAAPAR